MRVKSSRGFHSLCLDIPPWRYHMRTYRVLFKITPLCVLRLSWFNFALPEPHRVSPGREHLLWRKIHLQFCAIWKRSKLMKMAIEGEDGSVCSTAWNYRLVGCCLERPSFSRSPRHCLPEPGAAQPRNFWAYPWNSWDPQRPHTSHA